MLSLILNKLICKYRPLFFKEKKFYHHKKVKTTKTKVQPKMLFFNKTILFFNYIQHLEN
jgi:hypothetical protein